jgi:hypothetical protein
VTDPSGADLLGTSIGSGDDTPVVVTGGEFAFCYQLSAILIKDSDGTQGYDDTLNPGGEYKVWVCTDSAFAQCKTDNFKVKSNGGGPPEEEEATLRVIKFYDKNANGINDDSMDITGWKIHIIDAIDLIRFTPVVAIVDPDDYDVSEFLPIQTNWIPTTPTLVTITLEDGDDETIEFGNVCLGPGGGMTLGFWSNKNGQATMNDGGSVAPELALLSGLNLRTANGGNFDPGTYTALKNWLLNAKATNMAYMLSAQLAAMELNVEALKVSGSALVYAPGLLPFAPITGLNSLGFISISDLMTAANAALGADGYTPAGDPNRAYQEALKNVLDAANNNQNFVQLTPCTFSFTGDG